MTLKEMLGEDLYAQVVAACKGKAEGGKDVELGVINDGGFFPKDKFDAVNEKLKAAEKLAKETKEKLDGLQGAGDPVKLKADLEAAQKAVKDAAAKHMKEMADKDMHYAILSAISDAYDQNMVADKVDKSKLSLVGDKVHGLDEQLKILREEKSFLFKSVDGAPSITGAKLGDVGGSGQRTGAQPSTLSDAVQQAMYGNQN